MFTPPASPDPRRPTAPRTPSSASTIASDTSLRLDLHDDSFLSPSPSSSRSPSPSSRHDQAPLSPKEDPYTFAQQQLLKKRTGRRTRWAAVLVPLALVLIGLSTRFLTHPAALDVFATRDPSWQTVADWTPHKRHAHPDPAPVPAESTATTVGSATPTGTALSLASSSTAAPTVTAGSATVPTGTPDLPKPFPQPFDDTFSTNYSTVGCQDFMMNMTQTSAFRECRPFSLLVQDSNAFITSQKNITALNVILWGTCNTDLSEDQCVANMAWFEENIQTSCKTDLSAKNSVVLDALAGLQAYSVMRTAACAVNNSTDTYCYVDALQAASAADLYLYQLPLGLPLPNATVPSCDACVQRVMGAFAEGGAGVDALAETYADAAGTVNRACGAEFVAAQAAGSGAAGLRARWAAAVAAAVVVAAVGLL